MDSATSEIQKLTYVKVSTAVALVTPRIPQEIIDEILDNLVPDGCFTQWLRSCSLVSKSWVESCRRHLFHTVVLNGRGMAKWLKTFPIPEQSPAHHVRDLCLSLVEGYRTPEEFFRRTQWFTNVKKMTVWGRGGGDQPAWIPSFGRLPQSATTLTVNANTATLVQIRDVMVQLPNLNDLSLSGPLVVMDREKLRGIGTALRGKFGGRLQLLNIYADIVNMLLEIPTGLHFTNVYIRSVDECLLPAARLAEACGDNLVNLTYTVNDHDGHEPFSRTFDFAKSPNLREVKFSVYWTSGSLLWIPKALSTIKPTTSPRISDIELNFSGLSPWYTPRDSRERLFNELQLIEDEVARIKCEFVGVVNLTVHQNPGFGY